MPDQLQLRGGTTTERLAMTPALKELIVDTTRKSLAVGDGVTAGGHLLLREDIFATALGSETEPTAAALGMPSIAGLSWYKPSTGVLAKRDQADTAWIALGTLDEAAKTFAAPLTFAQLAALGMSAQPSHRNRLINGRMVWDQEHAGAAVTLTAGAALAYVLDQWYAWATGANLTGQRIQLSDGGYRYRFTGAAGNTGGGFAQRIEALRCFDLAGKTATLQIAASSTALALLTWTAYYANSADTFGTLASPSRTEIATGTFVIGTEETVNSVQIVLPAAATTGIEIDFTFGALGAAQTLILGNVQLEEGGAPTALEVLPPGLEQALCQRYYETGGFIAGGHAAGVDDFRSNVYFKVIKRTTPTLAYGASWTASVAVYDIRNPRVDGAECFVETINVTGTWVFGGNWFANARL